MNIYHYCINLVYSPHSGLVLAISSFTLLTLFRLRRVTRSIRLTILDHDIGFTLGLAFTWMVEVNLHQFYFCTILHKWHLWYAIKSRTWDLLSWLLDQLILASEVLRSTLCLSLLRVCQKFFIRVQDNCLSKRMGVQATIFVSLAYLNTILLCFFPLAVLLMLLYEIGKWRVKLILRWLS